MVIFLVRDVSTREHGTVVSHSVIQFCFHNNVKLILVERYEGHQTCISPLVKMEGFCCIKQFPSEYMHLECLGVTKWKLVFLETRAMVMQGCNSTKGHTFFQIKCSEPKLPSEFSYQPRYHLMNWIDGKPQSIVSFCFILPYLFYETYYTKSLPTFSFISYCNFHTIK